MRHGAEVKHCSSEGCTNKVVKGGVCIKHGAKVKLCSIEGCTNYVQRNGVCIRHGAKVKVKQCSYEGCTNQVVKGGICIRHGATVKAKRCSSEGCANRAINGGVCVRHGAKRKIKLCSSEGCTNHSKNGGLCTRHGAKVKLCSSEGCTNQTKNGGVCNKHSWAKVKLCSSQGCKNYAQKGGVCRKHWSSNLKPLNDGAKTSSQLPGGDIEALAGESTEAALEPKHRIFDERQKHTRTTLSPILHSPQVAATQGAIQESVQVDDDSFAKRRKTISFADVSPTPTSANDEAIAGNTVETVTELPPPPLPEVEHEWGEGESGTFVEDTMNASATMIGQSPQNTHPRAVKITPGKLLVLSEDAAVTTFEHNDSEDDRGDDSVRELAASLPDDRKEKTNLPGSSEPSTVARGKRSQPSRRRQKKSRRREVELCSLLHLHSTNIEDETGIHLSSKSPANNTSAFDSEKEPKATEGVPDISNSDMVETVMEIMVRDISEFLLLEEQTRVRLISSKIRDLVMAKGEKFVVRQFKSKKTNSQFLERVQTSPAQVKQWFDRKEIEFKGSKVIEDLHTIKTDGKGFFQNTACLRSLEMLTLSKPGDYTVLKLLGEMPRLKHVCIREGKNVRMRNRSNERSSRPSYQKYEPQDYTGAESVEQIELVRCKVPPELIGDLVRAPTKLSGLKVRRCDPKNIEDGSGHFFDMLSSFQGEEFKFCPETPLNPFVIGTPTNEEAAQANVDVLRREEGDMDNHAMLSNSILQCVCNNENLKSLSVRNVAVGEGSGIGPLRNLRGIQKLCLSALTSFQEDHLEFINGVGRDTLQKLSLVNCRLVEGHINRLNGLTKLEELSLTITSLCDSDIESLSNMRQLKVLNVFGQIQNDCNLSRLESLVNLRHLSLQIYNKVSLDVGGLPLGELSSLESLCLRWRFLEGNDEIDTGVAPILCVKVDEESTFKSSVIARMDESVMDETTVNGEEQENMFSMLISPFDLSPSIPHNLRSLVLYDSDITTNLVEFISENLNQLQNLSLWDCHALSEESVSHISTMQSLEKLCLHRFDAMTEESLEELSTFESIKELEFYLCKNIRDAEIDNSLGLMSNLRKLTISPYRLERPAHLTHLQLVKDKDEHNAKKRVESLLQKIYAKGLF